jgi:thioredoxin-related protein
VSDAHNLAADGRQAAESKTPIVVMFSADHCPYCEQVRRDYIDPLPDDPQYGRRVLVRIVTTDGDSTLTDFNGVETTHTHFAVDQGVSLVPTVRFYGVNGEQLVPDLVGAILPDFYLDYLEGAINQAVRKLEQTTLFRH